MSALFGWSSTAFDKLLEKATSHLLLEPDWDAVLQISDCIRQGDVQPKYAISCIKKKLYAQNPHVVLYTLLVLESCVKNCGAPIHAEIATRPFMEELRELVRSTTNENVKNRILELIQAWAHAFRNEPKYRAVQDIFNMLRMEGYKLQVLKESDAMFVADTAPDWADGSCCHRCRTVFSVVQRKHHCRNCGQIFCNKCSSRTSPIPRFGIEKEVRVCEACWEQLSKHPTSNTSSSETSPKQGAKLGGNTTMSKEEEELQLAIALSQKEATMKKKEGDPSNPAKKSEQELKEEEELQLALALSQSEAEIKEKSHVATKSSVYTPHSSVVDSQNSNDQNNKKGILTSTDPELERYLNRSYWEQRQQQQKDENPASSPETRTSPIPSAPVSSSALQNATNYNYHKVNEKYQNGDIDELSEFHTDLRSTLEIFVNRMKSNSSRGRPIANDTSVQSLFVKITNMRAQLLQYIQEQDDLRAYYERLQDKLNQIRDARAALDALREEHREKLRREAEEAERQRQIQMAHKLEIMRKKKQEYLQYQRQLAIQRMQEQEREMQMRHEQQRYHTMHPGGTVPLTGMFPPQQQPQQPYIQTAPQNYATLPPVNNNMAPPPPQNQQQVYHAPYTPQPQPPSSIPSQQMQGGEYHQPFNMQAMTAALPPSQMHPGVQFQRPHMIDDTRMPNNVAPIPNHVIMHPVMGPMMPHMGMIPQGMQQPMMHQNPPTTNMQSMPQMVSMPQQGHVMQPGIPAPTHEQQSPQNRQPPAQEQQDPLIIFD